jgi:hypothetical protein
VLGFVVEVLLLELLFGLLGFMLPLLPDAGAFDVSVVEPVVGAAGRVESPLEPVVPVVVLVEPVVPVAVEPVVLPEIESLLLDEPLTPVEWRAASVVPLRPLARRRFIVPCWLQSHLQSLPIESLPIASDEAVSRRGVELDALALLSVVDGEVDVEPDGLALLSVVDGEVEVEPLSVVALLAVSDRGVLLSVVEVGSVLVALLVLVEPG